MSREEQIKWLRRLLKSREDPRGDTEIDVALKCAIEALEQEPCGDCISREAVENAIKHAEVNFTVNSDIDFTKHKREVQEIVNGIIDAQIKALRDLPSVTAQSKMGRWITTRTFMHDGEYYCDRCKCDAPNNEKWDYCPNCGAKMSDVVDGMPEVKE